MISRAHAEITLHLSVTSLDTIRRRIPFRTPGPRALVLIGLGGSAICGWLMRDRATETVLGAVLATGGGAAGVALIHLLLFLPAYVSCCLAVPTLNPPEARSRFIAGLSVPRRLLAASLLTPVALLLACYLLMLGPTLVSVRLALTGAEPLVLIVIGCVTTMLLALAAALATFGLTVVLGSRLGPRSINGAGLVGVAGLAGAALAVITWHTAYAATGWSVPVARVVAVAELWAAPALGWGLAEPERSLVTGSLFLIGVLVVWLAAPLSLLPVPGSGFGRFGAALGDRLHRFPLGLPLVRGWRAPRVREFHHAAGAVLVLSTLVTWWSLGSVAEDGMVQNTIFTAAVFCGICSALFTAINRLTEASYEIVLGLPLATARAAVLVTSASVALLRYGVLTSISLAAVHQFTVANLLLYLDSATAASGVGLILGWFVLPAGRRRVPVDGLTIVACSGFLAAYGYATDVVGVPAGGVAQCAVSVVILAAATALVGARRVPGVPRARHRSVEGRVA